MTWNAGVLAGWPAGVPRLRSAGGEDAAWPAGATPAFQQKTASLYYADIAKGWLGAIGKLVAAISQ